MDGVNAENVGATCRLNAWIRLPKLNYFLVAFKPNSGNQ